MPAPPALGEFSSSPISSSPAFENSPSPPRGPSPPPPLHCQQLLDRGATGTVPAWHGPRETLSGSSPVQGAVKSLREPCQPASIPFLTSSDPTLPHSAPTDHALAYYGMVWPTGSWEWGLCPYERASLRVMAWLLPPTCQVRSHFSTRDPGVLLGTSISESPEGISSLDGGGVLLTSPQDGSFGVAGFGGQLPSGTARAGAGRNRASPPTGKQSERRVCIFILYTGRLL